MSHVVGGLGWFRVGTDAVGGVDIFVGVGWMDWVIAGCVVI